jgi:hypothetical protein
MHPRGNAACASNIQRKKRITIETLRYHPTGWVHSVSEEQDAGISFNIGKTYLYIRQHLARLVIEAHMNKMSVDDFIHILKTDIARAKTLVYLPNNVEVHHIDEDPQNDKLSNLMVLTKAEHTGHHCGEERFNKEYTKIARVVSIKDAGEKTVYDLSMLEPSCNFVVNLGIIVHNTGKTLSAKAISATLDLPLYKFDVGSVFKGIIGSSESTIRNALKLAETVAPCVLLIDEMEKLVAGLESSGRSDSGTTSRVIGTLLSWMQETTSPVYKVATCNTIRNLDAALFRRGRWDAVFAVDLPTFEERQEIFSIHLRKRGRKIEAFDLAALARGTEGFVGAEIESVVEEALYHAFDADRDISQADLVKVSSTVVPISKTDKEDVAQFREWMRTRAMPVSNALKNSVDTAKKSRTLRLTDSKN